MADFYRSWNISDFVVPVLFCYVAYRWIASRRLALPPGPKGLPVLGNSYQIPARKQWLKFDEWTKEYGMSCPCPPDLPHRNRPQGDLVYISIRGQPTLIVGSIAAANDLLRDRGKPLRPHPSTPGGSTRDLGNIYSDRPVSVMGGQMCAFHSRVPLKASLIPNSVGWGRGLGYTPGPHNPRFREFRKLFAQYIGPKGSSDPRVLDLQEKESRRLACRLLHTPEGFMKHFIRRDLSFRPTGNSAVIKNTSRTAGSIILLLAYGYQVTTDDDPILELAEEAMKGFTLVSEPNAFMVDNFPFCDLVFLCVTWKIDRWLVRYVPEWFPGGGFKKIAKEMFDDREKLYEVPFNFAREQMES